MRIIVSVPSPIRRRERAEFITAWLEHEINQKAFRKEQMNDQNRADSATQYSDDEPDVNRDGPRRVVECDCKNYAIEQLGSM